MKGLTNFFAAVVLLAMPLAALAQESMVLDYQGRLRAGGTAFSGTGYFMFVLEDRNGEIFWASGDFPLPSTTNNPPNALKIPVRQGVYEARLGEAGMPPLYPSALARLQNPQLVIWFNDLRHGWERVGQPVPLDNPLASLAEAGKRPITVSQADAILQELRGVRNLLERQNQPAPQPTPAPPTFATVSLNGPALGQSNAPLVLVEFTDYQCPYCKQFHETVLPALVKEFADTGKLRIVSRNLPLPFHANAEPAAQAALCANQQDKYWPMREKLFARNTELTPTNILGAAEAVSLDVVKFRACLAAKTFESAVSKDAQEAGAAGITGTPSFVLGKPDGDKLNGLVIVGAQPLATFETEIRKLLAPAK